MGVMAEAINNPMLEGMASDTMVLVDTYVAGGYSGGDDGSGTNIDVRSYGTIMINGVKYTSAADKKTLAWVKNDMGKRLKSH